MSQSPRPPELLALYKGYLARREAATFANQVSVRYAAGTLERLAGHPSREVRRAAVLALGLLGDYQANAALGGALLDKDRTVRILAENAIRSVWPRAGDETDRSQLAAMARLNAARQFQEVLQVAGELLVRSPGLAEAWSQRAYAHHALGHFAESIRDCHAALELNPYHFIAAVGMGRAYLELANPLAALESFRRALRLNPELQGVRAQTERLARMVEGNQ
ncbi:MAG: HEAT repeat domain-containing protein [Thermoguttaceae bacterium]